MGSKEYLVLVSKALDILKIELPPEKKDLETMLQILREVANGPIMSQSDISVHDEVRELVKAIELKKSSEEVTKIIDKLASETHYRDYWD